MAVTAVHFEDVHVFRWVGLKCLVCCVGFSENAPVFDPLVLEKGISADSVLGSAVSTAWAGPPKKKTKAIIHFERCQFESVRLITYDVDSRSDLIVSG